jgi:hypothetical protein
MKYNILFSGNRKFPRPENKLLTFSQCGKFLSVADGFAVWVWSCGRLVSLLQYSEHVSSKLRYYYGEGSDNRELGI